MGPPVLGNYHIYAYIYIYICGLNIGVILRLYGGYIGIMEKKTETAIIKFDGLGLGVPGNEFWDVWGLRCSGAVLRTHAGYDWLSALRNASAILNARLLRTVVYIYIGTCTHMGKSSMPSQCKNTQRVQCMESLPSP